MELAQRSRFWTAYRAAQTYTLTFHFFESRLSVEPLSGYSVSSLHPYIVMFLTRDREGTKQKTCFVRRTLHPVWNQTIVFSGINFEERVRMEVKTEKTFAENPLLAHFEASVREIMSLSLLSELPVHKLAFRSDRPGLEVEVTVGVFFDPPVAPDAFWFEGLSDHVQANILQMQQQHHHHQLHFLQQQQQQQQGEESTGAGSVGAGSLLGSSGLRPRAPSVSGTVPSLFSPAAGSGATAATATSVAAAAVAAGEEEVYLTVTDSFACLLLDANLQQELVQHQERLQQQQFQQQQQRSAHLLMQHMDDPPMAGQRLSDVADLPSAASSGSAASRFSFSAVDAVPALGAATTTTATTTTTTSSGSSSAAAPPPQGLVAARVRAFSPMRGGAATGAAAGGAKR